MSAGHLLRLGHLGLLLGAVVVTVLPLLFTTRYATNLLILGASWASRWRR